MIQRAKGTTVEIFSVSDPFDRQRRIQNWPQKAIEEAKVVVVGAGATGNEALKNLLLMGLRDVVICDFDRIEVSNLSRTVLFQRSDVGRLKAEVAARKCHDLALASHPQIRWFSGDVVWELGLGVLNGSSAILGCVDNVEARRAINKASRLLGIPFVDSGIRELGVTVSVFGGRPQDPCYECALSAQQFESSRSRYSCDNTKRDFVAAELVPTVQIASALAGALQAMETVRILSGDGSSFGTRQIWDGGSNFFRRSSLTPNPSCTAHACFESVQTTNLSATMPLGAFLERAESLLGLSGLSLDLTGDRTFLRAAACRSCNQMLPVDRPLFRVAEKSLECIEGVGAHCPRLASSVDRLPPGVPTARQAVSVFSASLTPDLLGVPLADLGVPLCHIVALRGEDGGERHVALDGDADTATVPV